MELYDLQTRDWTNVNASLCPGPQLASNILTRVCRHMCHREARFLDHRGLRCWYRQVCLWNSGTFLKCTVINASVRSCSALWSLQLQRALHAKLSVFHCQKGFKILRYDLLSNSVQSFTCSHFNKHPSFANGDRTCYHCRISSKLRKRSTKKTWIYSPE